MAQKTQGRNVKASIQLAVDDLATTEAFYGGILELQVQRSLTVPGAPEHLTLFSNEWELIFVETDALLLNHPVLEERFDVFPRGVGMTLHFSVTDLEGIYAAVLEDEPSNDNAEENKKIFHLSLLLTKNYNRHSKKCICDLFV
jgi:catechol 2,3-dioxygenase-like lactoylglutathione lyase family enzyme